MRQVMVRLQHILLHPRPAFTRLIEGQTRFSDAPWSLIEAVVPPGSVILEAGAADGSDTVKLAGLNSAGVRVFALEPIPTAFEKLKSKTSSLSNVTTIRSAVAPFSGTRSMWQSRGKGDTDSSSLLSPESHGKYFSGVNFGNQIQVDCLTVDLLLHRVGVSAFNFMWLDLQGLEIEVLRAAPVARSGATVIYMEVSRKQLYSGALTYGDVVNQMKKWGFKVAHDRVGAVSGNVLFIR